MSTEMTAAHRINWIPTQFGGYTGHVGTYEPWFFQLCKRPSRWELMATLPGAIGRSEYDADLGKLKARAEQMLEEFVSSLGAVFPGFSSFRVGGFDDEADKPTEPVKVICTRCSQASPWFTYRDDGGADRTAPLDDLVWWSRDHHCPRTAGGASRDHS